MAKALELCLTPWLYYYRLAIGLQDLSRLLVHHGRGLHPCPLCDKQVLSIPIIDHVISAHKRDWPEPQFSGSAAIAVAGW